MLTRKHKHIAKYCHQILKSCYFVKKYFQYCKKGNIEAVYFCVLEGINPEKINIKDGDRNAFIYACENDYKDML